MVTRSEESLEYDVQRFCDVLGEYDILAVRTIKHISEHLAGLEDSAFKIVCFLIASAVYVGTAAGHVFIYCIGDFFRFRE